MPNEDTALTEADLQAVWESSVDPVYAEDMLRAGDGNGLEAVQQNHAMLATVAGASLATFEQFYVRPWSGQKGEPAGGAARAEVTITLERGESLPQVGILALAGELVVEEEVPDWSLEGTLLVRPGRRYVLAEDLALAPGEPGPVTALFVAEKVGAGYNAPRPNTLVAFAQDGAGYDNALASVVFAGFGPMDLTGTSSARLVADPEPQVFVPGHIGALVQMLEGANTGAFFRVRAYVPPGLADGGSVEIDLVHTLRKDSGALAMQAGERVSFTNPTGPFAVVGYGTLLYQRLASGRSTLFVRIDSGASSTRIVGLTSGVVNACDGVWSTTLPVAETRTAAWRVLRWQDLLRATNVDRPTGGRADMLDEIGRERNIERASPAEDDESYRRRVANVPDVVSPNALRRAAARVLTHLGQEAVLREMGTPQQPGFFADHGFPDHASWWATGTVTSGTFAEGEPVEQVVDGVVVRLVFTGLSAGGTRLNGAHRFRRDAGFRSPTAPITGTRTGAVFTPTAVGGWQGRHGRYDWLQDTGWMRGSFVMSIPPTSEGDPGGVWNAMGNVGFWDAGPYAGAWGGSPTAERGKLLALWRAINDARGGGVLFAIVQDEGTDDNG